MTKFGPDRKTDESKNVCAELSSIEPRGEELPDWPNEEFRMKVKLSYGTYLGLLSKVSITASSVPGCGSLRSAGQDVPSPRGS